ncbi:universal stress protein [Allokutzneria albata]|uniref:Nucleotide-binding universal stress protein, UspA family n=1 Tax=Allokutzneria albata TaxID=211114 RepID=A0A1G9SQ01_ALLAB|nr:universal stress protein [Allokutzneria albata]SDM37538.1 Nucleotide-binding universal stress protein, UspA family [Allokutzneria albata]
MNAPIVIGVSPFADRRPVVSWAANEAVLRGRAVRLVHVCQELQWFGTSGVDALFGPRVQGEQVLREVEAAVRAAHPALEVTCGIADGDPAEVLVEESRAAELVVVGTHDQGRFADLVLGSVSRELVRRSAAPVITVPNLERPCVDGPVVVGVDGTEVSQEALRFALTEASRTGRRLYAVHCWPTPLDRAERSLVRDEECRVLAEALAGVSEEFPDVYVIPVLSGGDPAEELVWRSRDASMVVLGSRCRGALAAVVLGSVGRDVLRHASCPVAVVCPQDARVAPNSGRRVTSRDGDRSRSRPAGRRS